MSQSTKTPHGLGWQLADIVDSAQAIERLNCLRLVGTFDDDERDSDAVHCAIRALSQRIGLIAEHAAASVDGTHTIVLNGDGDPMRWMMPPAFFAEGDKTAGTSDGPR